jgi:hypothetical protein
MSANFQTDLEKFDDLMSKRRTCLAEAYRLLKAAEGILDELELKVKNSRERLSKSHLEQEALEKTDVTS